MRGKAPENLHHGERWRITPAYAGKSVEFADILDYSRDHPRLCGEKKKTPNWKTSGGGSPPPMRGKVGVQEMGISLSRITPAYAGKSHTVRA